MPSLPVSTDLTGSSITEAQAKTWFTQLRDFLSGLLGTAGTISTALAALQVPFGQGVEAKAGAYTVVAADRGKTFNCSGTWSLALTAAGTLGNGFMISVVNTGSGVITIDPSGGETIDGATTITLGAGLSAILVCTGTGWLSVTKSTAPYVEPTLAAGSTIYMRYDTEVPQTNGLDTYPATLSARTSDRGIEEWEAVPGNVGALRMDHAGVVTVSVEAKKDSTGDTELRVLVNGSQQVAWTLTSTSYVTRTQNVTVAKGDIVALQVRRAGINGGGATVRNVRLLVATLP